MLSRFVSFIDIGWEYELLECSWDLKELSLNIVGAEISSAIQADKKIKAIN